MKFILIIFVVMLLISFVFPLKFCVKSYPENSDQEFYVVRLDCLKNWWILAGDENGLYDWNTVADIPVEIHGKDFRQIVSGDLYLRDMPTYFILWGNAEIKKQYDDKNNVISQEFIVNCTDWDILEQVHSRNEFRMQFSNKYLTIYDYKWFDDFRKAVWEFEEY